MPQKIKFVKLLSELRTISQHDLKKDANKKLHAKMNEQFTNRWDCAEVVQGKTVFSKFNRLTFPRRKYVDVCVHCCEGDLCNWTGAWAEDTL